MAKDFGKLSREKNTSAHRAKIAAAYSVCALVWGTTWFAIRVSISPGGFPTYEADAAFLRRCCDHRCVRACWSCQPETTAWAPIVVAMCGPSSQRGELCPALCRVAASPGQCSVSFVCVPPFDNGGVGGRDAYRGYLWWSGARRRHGICWRRYDLLGSHGHIAPTGRRCCYGSGRRSHVCDIYVNHQMEDLRHALHGRDRRVLGSDRSRLVVFLSRPRIGASSLAFAIRTNSRRPLPERVRFDNSLLVLPLSVEAGQPNDREHACYG